MQIDSLWIRFDSSLNADSFALVFYSAPIYANRDLFILNQSYYFSRCAHVRIIQGEIFWQGAVWIDAVDPESISSILLLFVYSVSLACQFMQLRVVLHWGAFTNEFHLHDKTSLLMTQSRYGNYTFISARPSSYRASPCNNRRSVESSWMFFRDRGCFGSVSHIIAFGTRTGTAKIYFFILHSSPQTENHKNKIIKCLPKRASGDV